MFSFNFPAAVLNREPDRSLELQNLFLTAGGILFYPAARWILNHFLLEPVARRLVILSSVAEASNVRAKHRRLVNKISESLWKVLVYSMMFTLEMRAIKSEPWVSVTAELWKGWPHQTQSEESRQLYFWQLTLYYASILMLLLWETRRKDMYIMLGHHIISVILISASFRQRFIRVGCIVMMLHDVNDIFLEAAKILNYCKWETASMVVFGAFVLCWVVTRLTYFPFVIIWSTMVELPKVVENSPPTLWTFQLLLLCLFFINVYWFFLIMQVVWVKLTTGKGKDIRESEEHSKQE